ncbi:hypothetical protein RclHR1_09710001 [Rhizophagus clarus]|uniref:Uncharacterized protein n=1 Tax=Rhizophagus clarus TaxID=94130 RepID=A0A2Z6SI75_9GLOM|nr:hypothetical protein RclHR1_09710001 [Rhizophagus clarus]
MDYFRSSNFVVNVNDKQQRNIVLDLCKLILSFGYGSCNFQFSINGLNRYEVDELLKSVFESKNIGVCSISDSSVYVSLNRDMSNNKALRICKV